LDVCSVHQVRVTVDDSSHTLVEVGLAVEGDLNGLHGEVCMALVKHLPECNLGIAGNVDVLRTVADKLKKTTTHIVCLSTRKIIYRIGRRTKLIHVYVKSLGCFML